MTHLALFCAVLLFFCGCEDKSVNRDKRDVVAVYTGPGVWLESATAMQAALRSGNWKVDTLGVRRLLDGELSRYGILVVPGGDPNEISSAWGPIGRETVKDFVLTGGGYFGVGGGAVVADSNANAWQGIGMFTGDAVWPVGKIAPYPQTVMTQIRLDYRIHQIAAGGLDHYTVLYRYGPEFITGAATSVDIVYRYELSNTPALVASRFGQGSYVLVGFQPEFEENSDRDSVTVGSHLLDPDSEWDMIGRIVNYLMPID